MTDTGDIDVRRVERVTPMSDSNNTETGGYPRKRARTRRALLTAGMVVLAEKGPEGATVGEIARQAHVSSGTFYNHFVSIADLDDGEWFAPDVAVADTVVGEGDNAGRVVR